MGKTKYQVSWQTEFPWLSRVASDLYSAHCTVYLKSFKIDNQGIAKVKSHAQCHKTNNKKKDILKSFLAQRTIVIHDAEHIKNTCILLAQEKITKAEVLGALYLL